MREIHRSGSTPRGLLFRHGKVRLGPEFGVRVIAPTNAVAGMFLQFSNNARQRVSVDLGGGTIRYEGAHGGDYPELSVWAISLYGGIVLADESQDSDDQSTLLYAMTATNEFLQRPAVVDVFGDGQAREPA